MKMSAVCVHMVDGLHEEYQQILQVVGETFILLLHVNGCALVPLIHFWNLHALGADMAEIPQHRQWVTIHSSTQLHDGHLNGRSQTRRAQPCPDLFFQLIISAASLRGKGPAAVAQARLPAGSINV